MPDVTRKTVSASQAAALFNRSPYLTRWMLYHWAKGQDIDGPGDERMAIGTRLERVILEMAADELGIEVTPHKAQTYQAHDTEPVGCTIDATCWDPALGDGVVEAKSVDYLIWKDQWSEEMAPPHIEIQLQVQLMVREAAWGVIAALVGGNQLKIYRRWPNEHLQKEIVREARAFFEEVANNRCPPIQGMPREFAVLDAMYPETDSVEVAAGDEMTAAAVEEYRERKKQAAEAGVAADRAKAQILETAGKAGVIEAPGYRIYLGWANVREKRVQLSEAQARAIRLAFLDDMPDFITDLLDNGILVSPATKRRKPLSIKENDYE